MIITYIRSSSISSYNWCPHKFYISSNLGIKEGSGKAADLGNIVHKALELLARKKLADQLGQPTFFDEELNATFNSEGFTPDIAVQLGWDNYTNPARTTHNWMPADLKQARKLTNDVMVYRDGMFNPLKREVVMPEQYFDIEITEPWARYQYKHPDKPGEYIEGNLRIKGTMDLITRATPTMIEYIDWKTGKRIDWETDKEKGYEDLRKDFQMRLYHYALCKLYPNDHVLMTIYFIKSGGAFTLLLERSDLKSTEGMIRTHFEAIKRDNRPRRIRDFNPNSWKCSRLCKFFKESDKESGKNLCDHYRDKIYQIGIEKVTAKHRIEESPWGAYGSGGGVSNRDGEKK